jgi:hypothetical protein
VVITLSLQVVIASGQEFDNITKEQLRQYRVGNAWLLLLHEASLNRQRVSQGGAPAGVCWSRRHRTSEAQGVRQSEKKMEACRLISCFGAFRMQTNLC